MPLLLISSQVFLDAKLPAEKVRGKKQPVFAQLSNTPILKTLCPLSLADSKSLKEKYNCSFPHEAHVMCSPSFPQLFLSLRYFMHLVSSTGVEYRGACSPSLHSWVQYLVTETCQTGPAVQKCISRFLLLLGGKVLVITGVSYLEPLSKFLGPNSWSSRPTVQIHPTHVYTPACC